jgi:hypothetical protein
MLSLIRPKLLCDGQTCDVTEIMLIKSSVSMVQKYTNNFLLYFIIHKQRYFPIS